METEVYLNRHEKTGEEHIFRMQQLIRAYQHGKPPTEDLHMSCTLDQSYYTSLSDSSDRDKDQVVFRFISRNEELVEQRNNPKLSRDHVKKQSNQQMEPELTQLKKGRHPQIVMVSQLWLWKIDQGRC